MFIPIFIPRHHEPPKCPKCHNPENKKEVCSNCSYEYQEDKLSDKEAAWFGLFMIIGAVVGAFLMFDSHMPVLSVIIGLVGGVAALLFGSLVVYGIGFIIITLLGGK